MENNNYNSLAQSLIQKGILKSDGSQLQQTPEENIYEHNFFETEKPKNFKTQKNHKRINNYDLEIVKTGAAEDAAGKAINFKTMAQLKFLKTFLNKTKTSDLFFRVFPRLNKTKNVKEALTKLIELDLQIKKMLDKTTPYGESQARYDSLVKSLASLNEIQASLKG